MDEAKAIAQMKTGNIDALRTLVNLFQVQAVQAAVIITQERAAAEDIVQNAFLRCFERAELFDASRPFRPWFLRMVINDALKAAGKQRRYISLDAQEDETYRALIEKLDATLDEPEDILQRKEFHQAIRAALHKLSPQQRAVIVQRYYLGLSEQEMSDKLNCAPGTVKWHLHAARQRLRMLLVPFVK
jgi:RNA polymerase sigma-70 factor (ECF subfamily)